MTTLRSEFYHSCLICHNWSQMTLTDDYLRVSGCMSYWHDHLPGRSALHMQRRWCALQGMAAGLPCPAAKPTDMVFFSCSPPARWGLLDFIRAAASSFRLLLLLLLASSCRRTSTTAILAKCWLPDLNHGHPSPVLAAGPQPRPAPPSVGCRTSTTAIPAQCWLPDLNHHVKYNARDNMSDRMLEDMSDRMSDRYNVRYNVRHNVRRYVRYNVR